MRGCFIMDDAVVVEMHMGRTRGELGDYRHRALLYNELLGRMLEPLPQFCVVKGVEGWGSGIGGPRVWVVYSWTTGCP